MGGLLQYSGVVTKLRAMDSKLLRKKQYEELSGAASVSEVLGILKKYPAYEAVFQDLDESDAHREEIEKRIRNSLFQDFIKIYKFGNEEQDKMLDFFFVRYEIEAIKTCLRSVIQHSDERPDYSHWKELFQKHGNGNVDITSCCAAGSLEELLEALKGCPYYGLLNRIYQSGVRELFDYSMAMDFYHFSYIWKKKDKLLKKKELEVVTQNFGVQIDLLNMIWLARAKRYYEMTDAQLYALLIPIRYKLKSEEIRKMVESTSMEEFQQILSRSYYGRIRLQQQMDRDNLERMYEEFLRLFHKKDSRNHPYSVASIHAYLYAKEQEIDNVTTIVESIRYGIRPEEMLGYIRIAE